MIMAWVLLEKDMISDIRAQVETLRPQIPYFLSQQSHNDSRNALWIDIDWCIFETLHKCNLI